MNCARKRSIKSNSVSVNLILNAQPSILSPALVAEQRRSLLLLSEGEAPNLCAPQCSVPEPVEGLCLCGKKSEPARHPTQTGNFASCLHDHPPHRRHVRALPALLRAAHVQQRQGQTLWRGYRRTEWRIANDRGRRDAHWGGYRSCDRILSQRSVAGL